jgi:hypothetical protein
LFARLRDHDAVAIVLPVLVAHKSDRRSERRCYLALAAVPAAAGFVGPSIILRKDVMHSTNEDLVVAGVNTATESLTATSPNLQSA